MSGKISNLFRKCIVQMQIYTWRHGWVIFLLPFLLACTLFLNYGWKSQLSAQLITHKNALKIEKNNYQKLINAPTVLAQIDPDLANLQQLSERLYAQKDVGNLLQLIAQIAKNKNILLAQSEIQTIKEGHAGIHQLQVTLPVRTDYIGMRRFIQEVLLQLNGVSIDQISVKRDNVSQGQLEARIKLSLWIDTDKQTSRAISKP